MTIESSAAGNNAFTCSFAFIYREKLGGKMKEIVSKKDTNVTQFFNLFIVQMFTHKLG